MTRLMRGMIAGAAGTLALNILTYLDMLVRGRPPSQLPSQAAERFLGKAEGALGIDESEEKAPNRRSAAGALMGYATGLTIGASYGALVRKQSAAKLPTLVAGPVLGLTAMMATDAPMVKMGLTDPKTWSRNDWLADLIPHIGYGIVTAGAYRIMSR